jgi:hypothetical protein
MDLGDANLAVVALGFTFAELSGTYRFNALSSLADRCIAGQADLALRRAFSLRIQHFLHLRRSLGVTVKL